MFHAVPAPPPSRASNSGVVRDPKICGGEPAIKGTRVTLRMVLATLAEGATITARFRVTAGGGRAELLDVGRTPRGRPEGRPMAKALKVLAVGPAYNRVDREA